MPAAATDRGRVSGTTHFGPACPRWEKLAIGAFSASLWGGLRWSEIQRCAPSSLTIDGHLLRGIAWRSKVAKSGQPFGCWTFGATLRPPDRGWAHHWLRALHGWCAEVRSRAGPAVVVYCLVPVARDGNRCCVPMPYIQALRLFRWLLVQPWMDPLTAQGLSPSSYSLHLKATLTSWAHQLHLSEALRADLAHHRLAGGKGVRPPLSPRRRLGSPRGPASDCGSVGGGMASNYATGPRRPGAPG